MVNPNFDELMADLGLLWKRWQKEEFELRVEDRQSKASTKRMCMEDIERLIEKYDDGSVDIRLWGAGERDCDSNS